MWWGSYQWISFTWNFCEIYLEFLWVLPGISVRFTWNFCEIYLEFLWDLPGIFVRFTWNFCEISFLFSSSSLALCILSCCNQIQYQWNTHNKPCPAEPHSAISSKSDDRGREFNPGPAPYFRGDWSWNIFYGHSPPSTDSRRAVVSYKRKYVHWILVNRLIKSCSGKSEVRLTDSLHMTMMAIDWDNKPQTKQTLSRDMFPNNIETHFCMEDYGSVLYISGSSKFPKICNFRNSNLKTCSRSTKY